MNAYGYAFLFQVLLFFSMTVNAGLTAVAESGDPAADFPDGYQYRSLFDAFINNNGEVFIYGTAQGDTHPDLNCETFDNSSRESCNTLWIGKPDALKTAIKQGERVNGFPVDTVFDDYSAGTGVISDSGLLGFLGFIYMEGLRNTAIISHLNGVNYGIAYYGQKAPGFPPGNNFQSIDSIFLLSDAGLGFMAKVDSGVDGIWFWDKTDLQLIAAEEQEIGDLFPGCPISDTLISPLLIDINNTGEILFSANFDNEDSNCPSGGLFTWQNGSYQAIAISGDTTQDIGMPDGTSFSFTLGEIFGISGEINDNGDVLFTDNPFNESLGIGGLGQYDSVWIAKKNGNIRPVLFAGEDIPELQHTQTSGILYQGSSSMNDNGVAVISTGMYNRIANERGDVILVGEAKTKSYASFDDIASATNLKAVVYSGAPATVMGDDWAFSRLEEAEINNNNTVVFDGNVINEIEDAEESGVWMIDAQGNQELIALTWEPMIIDGETIELSKIIDVNMSNYNGSNAFQRKQLNDDNQFLFLGHIRYGGAGVYLYDSDITTSATPTPAPSPTPTPGSGVISTASTQAIELVQKAYLAYYGRPGDPAGIDYWAQKLDAAGGNWTHEILTAFGNSEEFQSRFGNYADETLVINIYQQLFFRQPEPAGLEYFVNLLESGQSSLSQIAVDILNGAVGFDASSVTNKLVVCDYFTQKVADGLIIYDSIDEIKNIIWNVIGGDSDNSSITDAKKAIDAIAQ